MLNYLKQVDPDRMIMSITICVVSVAVLICIMMLKSCATYMECSDACERAAESGAIVECLKHCD